jgi:hypothetical protein
MTTELFDRKPSAGAQLASQIDWRAKKIRGIHFPDLAKIPITDKSLRQAQVQKITRDCGCGFAAAFAVTVTLCYGAAIGLLLISVSESAFWSYASVAVLFVVAAIVGKLISQIRNQSRLRRLRDEIKIEVINSLLGMQRR